VDALTELRPAPEAMETKRAALHSDANTATGYVFTINCVTYGNRYSVAAFPHLSHNRRLHGAESKDLGGA
jgi:hypothetical protein